MLVLVTVRNAINVSGSVSALTRTPGIPIETRIDVEARSAADMMGLRNVCPQRRPVRMTHDACYPG